MKELFYIDDTTSNKISYWHLVCFLVVLPFDFFYSEIVLVSFGIHTLIHCKKTSLKNLVSKEVLVMISLYLVSFISILYSTDKPEGFNIATRQLSILLFPLLFALTDLNIVKYRLNLFLFFSVSCIFTIIYLYIDALHTIAYFKLPVSALLTLAFMNHNFSLPIDMHATYLSMYVAFSIITLIWMLLVTKSTRAKYLYLTGILILTLGMLQLSSRAVFIALLVVINIVFPFIVFSGKQRSRFILIVFSLSALLVFTITRVDSFKVRYISELRKDLTQKVDLIETNEPRMARWKATLELVKRSPVIGYGLGSEKKLLKEKYFEEKLYSSYINEFNTHSEYLSFLLKTGVVGLAFFLYVLYFGFGTAWQRKDLFFLSFLILVSMICISENLLDLNKGIFFYSFFFALFLFKQPADKVPGTAPHQGNPG